MGCAEQESATVVAQRVPGDAAEVWLCWRFTVADSCCFTDCNNNGLLLLHSLVNFYEDVELRTVHTSQGSQVENTQQHNGI